MPDRKTDYERNKPDPYPLLSESMRKVVDYQAAHAADAFDTNCSWDELRVKYVQERRFWNEGGPEAFKTVEVMVPGPIGDVPARIYYPDDKPEHYAVVFIHGGGYTVGSNDTHDRMMRSVMASSWSSPPMVPTGCGANRPSSRFSTYSYAWNASV